MRLIKFCITTIFLLSYIFCVKIDAQKFYDFSLIEGILIYDVNEVSDSIPINIIFIPFQINRNYSLNENITECLSKNSVNYFTCFQNIRHTQSYLNSYLDLIDTSVTNKFVISNRLKLALQASKKLNGKAIGFPSAPYPNISNCDVKIIVGAILFDKSLIDYYKKQSNFPHNPLIKTFDLKINNLITEVKYYQYAFSDSLGMRFAFLPIILPN